ncbi:MAG: hypothetical protein ACREDV_06770 [Methylocella sp.]
MFEDDETDAATNANGRLPATHVWIAAMNGFTPGMFMIRERL